MKKTSRLRFAFVCDCDLYFITSQLHYLFVRWRYDFYDVKTMLHFGTFELRKEITLQNGHFLAKFVCITKNDEKIPKYYVIC